MSRKKEGISGRSSNQTIEKRRRICRELFYSMPNLSQRVFIEKYAEKLKMNKMDVPKDQTLINDTKKLGFSFHQRLETSNPTKTIFRAMGHKIKYCLRQIRIGCINADILLYDSNTSFNITSKDNFTMPLALLKNNNKDDTYVNVPTDTSLVCLSFILNEKGFETYIEDVFNKYFKMTCNYLYSDTHNYCTQIFFEYKQLDKMMEYVYETVSVLVVYD